MKGMNIVIAIVFTVILAIITIGVIFAIIGMTPQEIEKGVSGVTNTPEEELSFYNYDDLLEKPVKKFDATCDMLQSCMLYTFKYKKPCQLGVYSSDGTFNMRDSVDVLKDCKFDVVSYVAPKIEQFLCEFNITPNVNYNIFNPQNISDANGLYFYNMNMKKADFYNESKNPAIDPDKLPLNSEQFSEIYAFAYFVPTWWFGNGSYRFAVMKVDVNTTNKKCILGIGVTRYPYIAKNKNEPTIKLFDAMRTINFAQPENDWRARKILAEYDAMVSTEAGTSCKNANGLSATFFCNKDAYGNEEECYYNFLTKNYKCKHYYYRLNTIVVDIPNDLQFEYGTPGGREKITDAIKFGLYANPTLRQYNFSTQQWDIPDTPPLGSYPNPWAYTLTQYLKNHENRAIWGGYITNVPQQIVVNVGWDIKNKDGKKYILPVVAWMGGVKG